MSLLSLLFIQFRPSTFRSAARMIRINHYFPVQVPSLASCWWKHKIFSLKMAFPAFHKLTLAHLQPHASSVFEINYVVSYIHFMHLCLGYAVPSIYNSFFYLFAWKISTYPSKLSFNIISSINLSWLSWSAKQIWLVALQC